MSLGISNPAHDADNSSNCNGNTVSNQETNVNIQNVNSISKKCTDCSCPMKELDAKCCTLDGIMPAYRSVEIFPESDFNSDANSLDSLIPNGGYGWVVVLASFMCNLTVDGICYTFGLFLPHFLEEFGSNKATTALAGSLLSGCYMTAGVFVSGLVNRFGCRPVTIVGSILAALSFVISTQAPNVYVLILTYGVITGSCFGLIYLPSIVSVGYYFSTKRAFATGIAVCGSGMGAFLFAPLCHWLLTQFNWNISLLILAGLILTCSMYGVLMKPLESGMKSGSEKKSKEKFEKCVVSCIEEVKEVNDDKFMNKIKSEKSSPIEEIFDLSVLKIPAMTLLSLSNIFGMTGYYIPYVYIVSFAKQTIRVDDQLISGNKAALLLSSIGISNVIGRLIFGIISDKCANMKIYGTKIRITALLINNVCMLMAGLATMGIPFCHSYWVLMADCILFGFTISSYMSLTSIILVDLLSLERLSTTFGLISCFRGISSILGPPLAGLLYELTDSFTGVFISAGILIVIASAISFIVHRYEKNQFQ